jgi:hypothetical protein
MELEERNQYEFNENTHSPNGVFNYVIKVSTMGG